MLIKKIQYEGKIALITKMALIFVSRDHSYFTQALARGGGLENGNLCIFSLHKTCYHRGRGGVGS